MSTKKHARKIQQQAKTSFLGLMAKYRTHTITTIFNEQSNKVRMLKFTQFKLVYTPLINILYVSIFTDYWKCSSFINTQSTFGLLHYYAQLTRNFNQAQQVELPRVYFNTLTINNILIFSKPKRQLFFMLYKSKPSFLFTGGLMRLVMNEKKKSSKRLYKVATSLIKLAGILVNTRRFFTSYYVRLINLGSIRSKILKTLNNSFNTQVRYIMIILRINVGAQKFNTRRSIKKYIKKRFKTIN